MKKLGSMQIINVHAAGIDIGSKSHYVGVGQKQSGGCGCLNNQRPHKTRVTLITGLQTKQQEEHYQEK